MLNHLYPVDYRLFYPDILLNSNYNSSVFWLISSYFILYNLRQTLRKRVNPHQMRRSGFALVTHLPFRSARYEPI